MSREWELATTKGNAIKGASAVAQRQLPTEPVTGMRGKLLGRIIIESFEPDDLSSDGIAFLVDIGPVTTPASLQFAKDVIGKLHARLQHQK